MLPTVKPSSSLFSPYKVTARKELLGITTLSSSDVEAMIKFICDGDSGHLNQGRYHLIVFDRYFKGRAWVWPELERWRTIAATLNRWPSTWGKWERSADVGEKHHDEAVNLQRYTLLMRTINFRARGLHQKN